MTAFPSYTVEKIETELTDEQMTLLVESRLNRVQGTSGDTTEDLALNALDSKGKVTRMNIEDMENMPGFAVEKVVVHRG